MSYPTYPYTTQFMQPTQARLNQMEQQFPQFAQNYQPYQPASVLKGRPVTSYDEAKASMIDLDGSVFVFPDFGNGKIYTKQINLDGTATINTYSLDGGLKSSQKDVEPIKSEPKTLDLINNLQSQINALKDEIGRLQMGRGEKNEESVYADDAIRKYDAKSKSGNH